MVQKLPSKQSLRQIRVFSRVWGKCRALERRTGRALERRTGRLQGTVSIITALPIRLDAEIYFEDRKTSDKGILADLCARDRVMKYHSRIKSNCMKYWKIFRALGKTKPEGWNLGIFFTFSFKGIIPAYTQTHRRVMKFCHIDKFSTPPAHLMMLKFCKLDRISIVTENRHNYI